MPIAIATCWLSATARIAMPVRLFRKNQVKAARNTRLTPAPTSCTGGSMTGPRSSGSSPIGRTIARVPAPNSQRRDAAQHRGEPDRRHDHGDHRPADQRPQHDPLEPEAERDHAGDRQQRRETQNGAPADAGGAGRDKAGEHDEFALREVDRVGRLVDQHEAERDQRVHQADHDPVGQQDQRELPVEHPGIAPRSELSLHAARDGRAGSAARPRVRARVAGSSTSPIARTERSIALRPSS